MAVFQLQLKVVTKNVVSILEWSRNRGENSHISSYSIYLKILLLALKKKRMSFEWDSEGVQLNFIRKSGACQSYNNEKTTKNSMAKN